MATGPGARRPSPTRARAIRRRRSLAGLAVILCLTADAWSVWSSVSPADAGEPMSERVARPAATATPGSTATRPTAPVDEAEQVPDAATDSQVSGSSPAAAKPGSSAAKGDKPDAKGDGKDAKGTVIEAGSGRFTVVAMPASALRPAPSGGRTVRYTVEVEGGIDVSSQDFATTVGRVLTDPRGWQTQDGVRFVDVSPSDAAKGAAVDLRVSLASPATTDRLCAPLETRGQVSCHNGGRVVLNLRRWVLGADAYGTDIAGYRTYLVNHEVGHGIGHPHEYCGGKGQVAPVMMQQTYGLKGCTAWPWPTPKPA